MATFSSCFFKVRLLLAIVSTVGLTLAGPALTYAQDIPTPTPPADGGEFEGAPDPTPGPELEPESVESEAADVVPEVSEPLSEDPEEQLPEDVTDTAPGASLDATSDTPELIESTEDTISDPLTGDAVLEPVVEEPAVQEPVVEEPAVDDASVANDPETDEDDAAVSGEVAPANNSPRGLW